MNDNRIRSTTPSQASSYTELNTNNIHQIFRAFHAVRSIKIHTYSTFQPGETMKEAPDSIQAIQNRGRKPGNQIEYLPRQFPVASGNTGLHPVPPADVFYTDIPTVMQGVIKCLNRPVKVNRGWARSTSGRAQRAGGRSLRYRFTIEQPTYSITSELEAHVLSTPSALTPPVACGNTGLHPVLPKLSPAYHTGNFCIFSYRLC